MEKIELNKYQTIFYIIWDNEDKTIDDLNDYLKITKGDNWVCGRSNSNPNTLYISEKNGNIECNSFYRLDQYVVDFGTSFWCIDKGDFDKGDFIKKWKQKLF